MGSESVRDRTVRLLRAVSAIQLVALVILVAGPASMAGASRGAFVTSCNYSHSLRDDPIMFPGEPGASHLHDFFGNETTNASSTVRSLRSGETRCLLESDTAAYWAPTAYLDSTRVRPDRVRAYYFGIAKGELQTLPAGLQMLAGNAMASSAGENPNVHWFCGAAQKTAFATPLSGHPYDCTPWARGHSFVDGIVAKVDFPNCWNGEGTSPSDVTYPDHGCPTDFPYKIPKLILRIHYGVMDPCAGASPCRAGRASAENVALSFSAGDYVTYHADFWNEWHQRPHDRLIDGCLRAHIDCGGQRS
jgi:hypothetical protein